MIKVKTNGDAVEMEIQLYRGLSSLELSLSEALKSVQTRLSKTKSFKDIYNARDQDYIELVDDLDLTWINSDIDKAIRTIRNLTESKIIHYYACQEDKVVD